jgi:hypothetical protein
VWQALFESLADQSFVVIAVALDQPEAARAWIEASSPTYPCLIDRDHHVADLFNLVNVPQAVWIDESGRIVRPPETAGSGNGLRFMDRSTGALPEAVMAERKRIKSVYMDAVRDWARHGASSQHVLDAPTAASRLPQASAQIAQAHAHFRLGQHLQRQGQAQAARQAFDEAVRLHPESWSIWRQAAPKDARGLAAGPDFWARVDALGERDYYAPIDMAGIRPAS